MIGTNYNSFAYGNGFNSYRPGVGTDYSNFGKSDSAVQSAEEKQKAQLKNLPWASEEDEDDKKSGKMRSKGHIDDPSCECQTCKNRKYQDGSDEMVSFKSAQRIAPSAVAAKVRGHEQEHVVNAYEKAAQNNGKVIRASVTLHTAVCPECGRTYVSGGETCTKIAYSNEENPYTQARKAMNKQGLLGANVDLAG